MKPALFFLIVFLFGRGLQIRILFFFWSVNVYEKVRFEIGCLSCKFIPKWTSIDVMTGTVGRLDTF